MRKLLLMIMNSSPRLRHTSSTGLEISGVLLRTYVLVPECNNKPRLLLYYKFRLRTFVLLQH